MSLTMSCYLLGILSIICTILSLAMRSDVPDKDVTDTAWSDSEGRRRLLVAGTIQIIIAAAPTALILVLVHKAGSAGLIDVAQDADRWITYNFGRSADESSRMVFLVFVFALIVVVGLKMLRRAMINSSTWNVGPRAPIGAPIWWRVIDQLPTIASAGVVAALLAISTPTSIAVGATLATVDLSIRFGRVLAYGRASKLSDAVGAAVGIPLIAVTDYLLLHRADFGDGVTLFITTIFVGVVFAAFDPECNSLLAGRIERTVTRVKEYIAARRATADL